MNDRKLLIMGYGFSSQAIAQAAEKEFVQIAGTTRSAEKFDKLEADGVQPVVFTVDGDMAGVTAFLEQATHLLVSIGPGEAGDPVLNALGNAITDAPHLRWIGYLSTVGVYGDHNGAWVDEDTPPKPVSKRSIQRVAAETAWQELADKRSIPLAVFRLSGIYGPGRNAFMNMEKGTARRLVKPGQVFNRIHREDIGQAVALAMKGNIGGIFNITDDEPSPPQDVVTYAHELAGRTPPPETDFETAELTPMARSFYGENKRVSNARSRQVLGMTYRWPNYRTSLKRMWEENLWQPVSR